MVFIGYWSCEQVGQPIATLAASYKIGDGFRNSATIIEAFAAEPWQSLSLRRRN